MLSMAATLFAASSCKQGDASQDMQIGFQMYSVRNDLQKDFEGTLKKVSDMGFDGVEFFSEYYGRTPQEVRDLCDNPPFSVDDLYGVYGFGQKKIELFGQRFVDAVNAYTRNIP